MSAIDFGMTVASAVMERTIQQSPIPLTRTGTVVAAGLRSVGVLVDGDTVHLSAQNITQMWLVVGQRVTVMFMPPHGVFVVGGLPGQWEDYTPEFTGSVTNPNVGATGYVRGAYTLDGSTVHFRADVQFLGAGVSAGSGTYVITLPIPARSGVILLCHGRLYDNSADQIVNITGDTGISVGGVRMVREATAAANYLVSASQPWTWAASDAIQLNGTYECDLSAI